MSIEQSKIEFRSAARGYIYEYAKPLNPKNLSERKFRNIGFGHTSSILEAASLRKKYIRRIQNAAAGLSEAELREVQQDIAAKYKYDKEIGIIDHDEIGKPDTKFIMIENYYDRANVAELLEEAVQIALGNPAKAKSVYSRFEDRPPAPLKAHRPTYDAMMRGAHFDI